MKAKKQQTTHSSTEILFFSFPFKLFKTIYGYFGYHKEVGLSLSIMRVYMYSFIQKMNFLMSLMMESRG